ncbi:MAG TPA: hypothetical protein VER17_17290 [Tepidisphaeraceae bacterium]|nr:hypothetical protein [Tepidisphaeraceae bacterium]
MFLGDPQLNGGCPRPLRVSFSIGGSEHPLKRPRRGSRRAPAPPPAPGQLVAVAVLSYPTPQLRARERALALVGPRYGAKLAFVNAHVRTISRVIVHPQFRSLGLASALVRCVLLNCPVRYVEAVATMGDVHPFFERAGMTRIPPAGQGEAAYFLFDRLSCSDDSKDAEDARGTTETSGATRATGVTSTTGAMGSIAATGKGGVR